MREIKFRVWNGAEMDYDILAGRFGAFYVNPGASGDGLDEQDRASLSTFNTKYSDVPLMQYTGLKDKNGKEIYEGDLLRDEPSPMIVKWNDRLSCFGLERKGWAFTHFFQEAINSDECEVIGNIYENPELLN